MSSFRSRSSAQKSISIDLLGGIGNQLFRYYAATSIAEKLNLRVRFFLGELPQSHSQFNSRILDLGFSITPEARPTPKSYSLLLQRIFDYLSAKSICLKKVIQVFRGIYTERGLSTLEECNLVLERFQRFPYPRNIHLDGHFQDITYFSDRYSAKNQAGQLMKAQQISSNLVFEKQNYDFESLCVVHIRRGDFKNHKNDIGLLGKDYYRNAMSKFIDSCENPHFLIISDDMSETEMMVLDDHRHLCTFLRESDQINPGDLIKLICEYKNFILSNSTFSLWIALLAPETKYVAYPVPFNRNLELQVRGFPNSWKPETAHFE